MCTPSKHAKPTKGIAEETKRNESLRATFCTGRCLCACGYAYVRMHTYAYPTRGDPVFAGLCFCSEHTGVLKVLTLFRPLGGYCTFGGRALLIYAPAPRKCSTPPGARKGCGLYVPIPTPTRKTYPYGFLVGARHGYAWVWIPRESICMHTPTSTVAVQAAVQKEALSK